MSGVEVFRLESFDDRIDGLWERVSPEHQVIGIRDSDHLNWRFNTPVPDAAYHCIAAACGKILLGYLIYRIVEQDGEHYGDISSIFSPKVIRTASLRCFCEKLRSG